MNGRSEAVGGFQNGGLGDFQNGNSTTGGFNGGGVGQTNGSANTQLNGGLLRQDSLPNSSAFNNNGPGSQQVVPQTNPVFSTNSSSGALSSGISAANGRGAGVGALENGGLNNFQNGNSTSGGFNGGGMGLNTSPNTRLNGGFSGPNFFPNSSAPNNNSAAANQQAASQRNQLSGVNGRAGTTNSGIGGVNGRELGVGGLETGASSRPQNGTTSTGRLDGAGTGQSNARVASANNQLLAGPLGANYSPSNNPASNNASANSNYAAGSVNASSVANPGPNGIGSNSGPPIGVESVDGHFQYDWW